MTHNTTLRSLATRIDEVESRAKAMRQESERLVRATQDLKQLMDELSKELEKEGESKPDTTLEGAILAFMGTNSYVNLPILADEFRSVSLEDLTRAVKNLVSTERVVSRWSAESGTILLSRKEGAE